MKLKLIGITSFLALFFVMLFSGAPKASAASFNYTTYLIDNSTFRASFTMTASDIQNFLVSKGSGLANFVDIENCGSTTGPNYAFYAKYYSCGTPQKASQIIYDASQAYGINPQVLLATMQKEQSLVTTPNPTSSQLTFAMGYGCPDSGGCSYPGFFSQVDNASWQFRADYELSSGNSYWGYAPSNYVCNGATRYYSAALVPGSNVTFYDDYGTGYANFVIPNAATGSLYCYTPHVFPGSAKQYYSGSYWFVYYFSQWFGGGVTPYAFVAQGSNTVYLFVEGYKVAVPSMAMLQDYGISPSSIQTLSQSQVDSIPVPSLATNGISPTLSYLIQSTANPAIYVVSLGNKSLITNMDQFYGFNFSTSNISYLPSTFISTINGSQNLYDYITTPSSNAFQINSAQKRIIFNAQTYLSLNPSNQATAFSSYLASTIPSGLPITNSPILIQPNGSAAVYLLDNNNYYSISSFDVYTCWGFNGALNTPFYSLADNSFVSTITPTSSLNNCVVSNSLGNDYILNSSNKYLIPSAYGNFNPETLNTDLVNLVNEIPSGTNSLSQAVRISNSPTIYYLEDGMAKSIPSLTDLNLLGLNISGLDILNSSVLSSLQINGVKLGNGQVVSSPGSSTVYIVNNNSKIAISSADEFLAYGYNWSGIDSIPASTLTTYYPTTTNQLSQYLYNQPNNQLYLIDTNGCYALTPSLLTDFGLSLSNYSSGQQGYTPSLFPYLNLAYCQYGSQYVKSSNSSTVYTVANGELSAYSSWSDLLSRNYNSVPNIITLSPYDISTIPIGPGI